MKTIRIMHHQGPPERLLVPDDCHVRVELKEAIAYHNPSGQPSTTVIHVLQILRGEDVLASLPGIASFRDEAIQVERGTVTSDGLEWAPAE